VSNNACILLQDDKIPLQLAYEHFHKDVVNYLAKKTAYIDPILISKVLLFSEPCNYVAKYKILRMYVRTFC